MNHFDKSAIDRQEFLQKLKSAILICDENANVILYGSRARGDERVDSDWDLLVVTSKKTGYNEEDKIRENIYKIELEHLQPISTTIVDKQSWNDWEILPFYTNIKREGIIL